MIREGRGGMKKYLEIKNQGTVAAIVLATVFFSAPLANAGETSLVCRGNMGNAYLTTNPLYKVYDERTFYLTTQCTWLTRNVTKSGPCDYIFEGGRHEGYLYEDGAFNLSHFDPFTILDADGYLYFKMSETTNGLGGNEGQRWFSGICTERSE